MATSAQQQDETKIIVTSADVHKMQKLSGLAMSITREIGALHELMSQINCNDEDTDINEFLQQERLNLQMLLQKKYALLDTIDTMRATLLVQ